MDGAAETKGIAMSVRHLYEMVWLPENRMLRILLVSAVYACWIIIALYMISFAIPKPVVAAAFILFAVLAVLQLAMTLLRGSRSYRPDE